jgi:hypothetical protein
LNQRVDLDLSEKSAGAIVEHQRERVGLGERVVHAALAVFLTFALLWCVYQKKVTLVTTG